ncbi:MAG TPA: hypothetical protein VKR79_09815 [Gaiellaceae bacterium]|nr:hypothetical protein [Gaiellaceae bacterium]
MIYKRYGQPWTFLFAAVAIGLWSYFGDHDGAAGSVAAGILFGAAMSALAAAGNWFRDRRE